MSPSAIQIAPPNTQTKTHKFPSDEASTETYAHTLDANDPLHHFRNQYIIPTKTSLQSKTLIAPDQSADPEEQCVYFCGNSLGLQPKVTREIVERYLTTWSGIGVYGHFTELGFFEDGAQGDGEKKKTVAWQNLAESVAGKCARLVGAAPSEVAIMNSLSVNLHLLMAAFYKPENKQKKKVLLEWKAFPSDHYVVESQVRWHGLDPEECMVLLKPDDGEYIISTEKILRTIDEGRDEIALVLLPGIQYYTGQLFDIKRITEFAHERGIMIGWDLAHAAGNVEIKLSEWDVDFAAWCTYKYMNAGPGSIAGIFVNEKYGKVETDENGAVSFRPRLMGWYGGDQASRFKMDNKFRPIPGAGGYQVSNPSAIDLTSLSASLSVFDQTSMADLRQKSLKLTAYLQYLLLNDEPESDSERQFQIITPLDPSQRGAQLSVLLKPGLLKSVASTLKNAGIVADQREPDVVRVAPVPMYNTFHDVWYFVQQFKKALATQE